MIAIRQQIRKAMVGWLPRRAADAILAFKHRRSWRHDTRSHLEYQAQYVTRGALIEALQGWLAQQVRAQPRIVEFGCSGANNLRLMHERGMAGVQYIGLDISAEAIAFARRSHPDAQFHVCDDAGYAQLAPELGHADAWLAFAVLYYIPSDRVRTLLQIAARHADALFICDDLSRFDADTGSTEGLFVHPWAALCRDAGLQVVFGPVASADPANRHGLFVATPRRD